MKRMVHLLKVDPEFYDDLKSGKKTFELRNNDRNFQVGDGLCLTAYDRKTKEYGNEQLLTEVTYILDDDRYLKPGYVALGIKPPSCVPIMLDPRNTYQTIELYQEVDLCQ